MKIFALIGLLIVLAACQHDRDPQIGTDTGLTGYDPHLIENQTQACLDKGGRFAQGGSSGSFVCYENTNDANKRCTSGTECQGLCLARSGTCSPITPMFGCHEILGSLGARSTLCID